MSRYGRLADGPNKRVTPEDMLCWTDLIQQAGRAAAGEAGAAASALARVARASNNACAPGLVNLQNPFVRLSRLSRRYCDETAAGRRALQAELAAAVEAARAALPAAPAWKSRKDIEG